MRAAVLLLLLLSSMASGAQECTREVRINDSTFSLNKTLREDVEKRFGAAKPLKSAYEVPYYGLCYKSHDGKSALILGFDSTTNQLVSSTIGVWNDAVGEYIDCAQSSENQFLLNKNQIGQRAKKNGEQEKVVVSRDFCTIWEKSSAVSGVLVQFGVISSRLQ